jgi:hypothetical protein
LFVFAVIWQYKTKGKMKTKATILFMLSITVLSVVTVAQTSDLSYTMNSNIGLMYSSSSSDLNIVTLESDFRELSILKLSNTDTDLSFKVIQEAKSGVFKAIANYQFFESVEFSIFNNKGVEINKGILSDPETEINLSSMPSGYYIFHVYLNDGDFQVFRINLK